MTLENNQIISMEEQETSLKQEKIALMVAGMHRSGTSAITRVLNLCGADISEKLLPPQEANQMGYWESSSIVELHDQLLTSAGSSWRDVSLFPNGWFSSPVSQDFQNRMVQVLKQDFLHSSLFVIKDPRICRLIPFWLNVLERFGGKPYFIIPVRHPLEVAASLKERENFNTYQSLLLWLQHFLCAEKDSRKYPRCFITYNQLMTDWEQVIVKIERDLQLSFPRLSSLTKIEIDQFLKTELHHHQLREENISYRSDIVSWIDRVYQWGIKASNNEIVNLEELDQIYQVFGEADIAYGPIMAQYFLLEDQCQNLTQRKSELEQELKETQTQFENTKVNLYQQLAQTNADCENAKAQLLQQLAQCHTEFEKVQAQLHQQLEQAQIESENIRVNLHQQLEQAQIESENIRVNLHQQLEQTQVEFENTKAHLQQQLEQNYSDLEIYQTQLQQSQSELANSQAQLQQTQLDLTNSQGQLQQTQSDLQHTRSQLDEKERELEITRTLVLAMESSKFWQFRDKWFELKQFLKLDQGGFYEQIKQNSQYLGIFKGKIELRIDYAVLIPNLGIYVDLWLICLDSSLESITLMNKYGELVTGVESILQSKRRPDISDLLKSKGLPVNHDDHGLFGLIPFSSVSSYEKTKFYLQAKSRLGYCTKVEINTVISGEQNSLGIIKNILTNAPIPTYNMREILDNHIGPTVREIWRSRSQPKVKPHIVEYGKQVENPQVSVIVPLYGRIDFIKYQLALFADDPDFQNNELIYVLDDPRLQEQCIFLCENQSSLFQVPFKTLYLGTNLGYGGANNAGVAIAKGRLILLLNSDVMPKKTGWLSSLVNIHDSLSNPGSLGVKLLYGDGSIQHAGTKLFRCAAWDNLWSNEHPGKGQPNIPQPNATPQKIPTLTGACLMILKERYQRVGGFDESYILGDFEDSDLCLKLHQSGWENYYAPQIELFHLERQSVSRHGSEKLWQLNRTVYNCWLHHQNWDEYIRRHNLAQM
jgi:GT2 family glycosyltransferase